MPGSGCFQRKLAGLPRGGDGGVVALAGAVGAAEAVPVFGSWRLKWQLLIRSLHRTASHAKAQRREEVDLTTKAQRTRRMDLMNSLILPSCPLCLCGYAYCCYCLSLRFAPLRETILSYRSMWYCSILRYSVARPMPSSLAASGTLSPVRLRASVIRRFSQSSIRQRFQLARCPSRAGPGRAGGSTHRRPARRRCRARCEAAARCRASGSASSFARAASVRPRLGRPCWRRKWSRKKSISRPMSSPRSRSGGRCSSNTLSR